MNPRGGSAAAYEKGILAFIMLFVKNALGKGDAMGIISQEKARNYLPLDVQTRLSCCQRRANSGWSVKKICSYYHISRQSLWRRMARFGGSEGSLAERSHRPHSEWE